MTAPRPPFIPHRLIVIVVLLVGFAVSVASYRYGLFEERQKAESEFEHRAALRHALTREILGHYEDALFGLSALFATEANVSREDFVRATSRFDGAESIATRIAPAGTAAGATSTSASRWPR